MCSDGWLLVVDEIMEIVVEKMVIFFEWHVDGSIVTSCKSLALFVNALRQWIVAVCSIRAYFFACLPRWSRCLLNDFANFVHTWAAHVWANLPIL